MFEQILFISSLLVGEVTECFDRRRVIDNNNKGRLLPSRVEAFSQLNIRLVGVGSDQINLGPDQSKTS